MSLSNTPNLLLNAADTAELERNSIAGRRVIAAVAWHSLLWLVVANCVGVLLAATGATRLAWRSQFKRLPPNLEAGPWNHVPVFSSRQERVLRIAQIIKFGVPGTDMPGHEYLSEKEVASISLWLNQNMVLPHQVASTQSNQERTR